MKQTLCILSAIFIISFATAGVKNIHVPVVVSDTPRVITNKWLHDGTESAADNKANWQLNFKPVKDIFIIVNGRIYKQDINTINPSTVESIEVIHKEKLTEGLILIRSKREVFDQGLRPSYMPREAAISDAMDTLRQLSFFIGRKLSDGQADRYREMFMTTWLRMDSLNLLR